MEKKKMRIMFEIGFNRVVTEPMEPEAIMKQVIFLASCNPVKTTDKGGYFLDVDRRLRIEMLPVELVTNSTETNDR